MCCICISHDGFGLNDIAAITFVISLSIGVMTLSSHTHNGVTVGHPAGHTLSHHSVLSFVELECRLTLYSNQHLPRSSSMNPAAPPLFLPHSDTQYGPQPYNMTRDIIWTADELLCAASSDGAATIIVTISGCVRRQQSSGFPGVDTASFRY